mgnify:FL=1
MKKLLGILLVMLLVLVGCGKKEETPTPQEGATYKVGTAVITSEKGTDAGEEEGSMQVDTYYAHLVLDGDVIKDVYIDAAQNSVKFGTDDAITDFKGAGTKKELGDDYNMKKYGNAVAEWYEQIESLEEWMIGQTVDEVLAMPTYEKDDNHVAVPDVEDLKSSVTITVETYLELVKLAAENAVEVKDVVKVGTASTTSAKEDALEINTNIATVALNGNDEIVFAFIDAAQNKADLEGGKISLHGITKSKKQLGADYGMAVGNPNAVAEWDVQVESFEDHITGQKLSDVLGMKLSDGAPADADLKSSVTINVSGFLELIEKADKQARVIK